MNKSELVSEIQANLGDASKADAENALSAVLASIKTAIKKAGKTVKVSDKECEASGCNPARWIWNVFCNSPQRAFGNQSSDEGSIEDQSEQGDQVQARCWT